jgi:hypothetical protein
MAKKPKPPRGKGKKKAPNAASIKGDLKLAIFAEMDNIRRQKGLDMMMLTKALGVGDMAAFEKGFETHFEKSTPLRKLTKAEKEEETKIKPRLTKVSKEYKPVIPRKKGK